MFRKFNVSELLVKTIVSIQYDPKIDEVFG